MGMGSGNFGTLIGNVANKGGATDAPAYTPLPFGGKGAPATYDNYRPNYSYAAGPSYGNTQLPYGLGSSAPMPGGGVFGQKGGGPTMSPGFQAPSFGKTFNTLNYGRYPGSGIGYYNPTPEPNYNPSRPNYSNPVMPGPPAKGGPDIPPPSVEPPYVPPPYVPPPSVEPPYVPPPYVPPYVPPTFDRPDGEN